MYRTFSEVRKAYPHGFDLSEQELHRLHSCLDQQIQKLHPDAPTCSIFEVRFRNGVVTTLATLAEVLALENSGSGTITHLTMQAQDSASDPHSVIAVAFKSEDIKNWFEPNGISYRVQGSDRDWVFVTSSLVEERISRIKKIIPNSVGTLGWGNVVLLTVLVFTIAMALSIGGALNPRYYPPPTSETDGVNRLETSWKNGEITDPVETVIQIRKLERSTNRQPWQSTVISTFLLSCLL